jgi:hypothetical protein
MPSHDRPKRHSVKAMTRVEKAELDAQRNKEAEKTRRAIRQKEAAKKRTVKVTMDDLSHRFSNMKIAGRRGTTRRTVRKTRR